MKNKFLHLNATIALGNLKSQRISLIAICYVEIPVMNGRTIYDSSQAFEISAQEIKVD